MKAILCGGDAKAFAYLMQWFAYIFQKRTKPGVLVIFYGAPGIGKSCFVGENQSGKGLLPLIYGCYYQHETNLEHLLTNFNTSSYAKLFCCLEEATPYRKSHRNNDQLNAIITEGTVRIEPKGSPAEFRCCFPSEGHSRTLSRLEEAFRATKRDEPSPA